MKELFEFTDCATIETDIYRAKNPWTPSEPAADNSSFISMTAIISVPLLKFDLGRLHGRTIKRAVLRMMPVTEDCPLEVEISTVSHDWNGKHATLVFSDADKRWLDDNWFTDFIMGSGNSIHCCSPVKYDRARGIAEIGIAPILIYAMANGQSFGISLIDNKSKQYDAMENLVNKRFNVDSSKGAVPELEIEYFQEVQAIPAPVAGLESLPLLNGDSYSETAVELRWSLQEEGKDEYRYFNIYLRECCSELDKMAKVEKCFTPFYQAERKDYTTEIEGLRPETEYIAAVTLSNGINESEPLFTKFRTSGVPRKPAVGEIANPEGAFSNGCKLTEKGFNVYILNENTRVNPVNSKVFEADQSGVLHEGEAAPDKPGTLLFDGNEINLKAVPGEKLAFQILTENRQKKHKAYQAAPGGDLPEGLTITFNKIWYVKQDALWQPEIVIPGGRALSFDIPYAENKIKGQKNQAIYVEIFVADQASAGEYRTSIVISTEEGSVEIPLKLAVSGIKLEKADFSFELNGYVPVPSYSDCWFGSGDYDEIEKNYYISAYQHKTDINILPYTQYGAVHAGFAPRIALINGEPRVVDWSEWDSHFAAYLDGSYLEEWEGKKIPIRHMYLPFHENWPLSVDRYFKIEVGSREYPEMINEQKLKSSTIEEDFLPEYRKGIKSILKDFIRHFDEMGWNDVTFQFYNNNKQIAKKVKHLTLRGLNVQNAWISFQALGDEGRGTSWWNLEEQVFPDDFKATAFFADILREAQRETGSGYNIKCRTDISRYHHMFDYLDDRLDITVLSLRAFTLKLGLAKKRKRRFNEDYWVYAGLRRFAGLNSNLSLWCIESYLNGASRILPWNNYGRDNNFELYNENAIMYPGKRFGIKGPVASLKLKAVRKGMELVDYLETFRRACGYTELQLRSYVEKFLKFGQVDPMVDVNEPGSAKYAGNTDTELELLKRHIIDRLEAKQEAPKAEFSEELSVPAGEVAAGKDEKPNILIIMADEHRFDCLGAYGNKDIRTPSIDSLAADGVLYKNSFCPFPVCTPSRYSFLTGLYVHQHTGWTNHCTLAAGLDTLPRLLKAGGYKTSAVGKMHFTPTYLDAGFDRMVLSEQAGPGRYDDDYHRYLKERGLADRIDMMDQVWEHYIKAPEEYRDAFGAVESDLDEEHYSTTWIGDRALEEMEDWEGGGNMLMVGFIKPHHPFDPPAPWSRMYDPEKLSLLPGWTEEVPEQDRARHKGYYPNEKMTEAQLRKAMAYYYGTISQIDHHVGRMLEKLKEKGLYDDTIIVYTSDHGDYIGFHHMILKQNYMYDPLVKVPLIIKYRDSLNAGTVSEALANNIDIAPTLLKQAGCKPGSQMKGTDLVRNPEGSRYVFAEYGQSQDYMVRDARYKLLLARSESNCQFFDLEADPVELNNLYGDKACSGAIERLKKALFDWMLFDSPPMTYLNEQEQVVKGENVPSLEDNHREEIQSYLDKKMTDAKDILFGRKVK